MQPDFGGPVLAPLNYLFQECAALQGRRWLALLCNVIEDIRRLTFPKMSDYDGGGDDEKYVFMKRRTHAQGRHIHIVT